MNKSLLTIKELSSLLHLHPQTLYRWKAQHKIPFLKLGQEVRFERTDIEKFIERSKNRFLDLDGFPQKVELRLDDYDRMHLKGGCAVGKRARRWNYGFGSIFLRKTGKGKDRWYLDFKDREGKRRREAIRDAQSRGEALIALQSKVAQIFDSRFNPKRKAEPLKFGSLASMYIENYAKVKKLSWKADRSYIASMNKIFKDKLATEITPLDIEKFIKARLDEGVKKSTVNRCLAILKRIFNLAIDWGYCFENPMKKVRLFSEKDNLKERILSHDEEARLLESSPEHLRQIILFALNSGMRRGEILGLRWECVDFEKCAIKVEHSKSGRQRFVEMNGSLFELLRNLRMKEPRAEYVFTNPATAKPLTEVKRSFKSACQRAGIKGLRFHDLRHTFASRLIEAGSDIITVKDLLGHSSVKLTERYIHIGQEVKRKAVELLDEKSHANLAQIWHTEKTEAGKSSAIRLFSMN